MESWGQKRWVFIALVISLIAASCSGGEIEPGQLRGFDGNTVDENELIDAGEIRSDGSAPDSLAFRDPEESGVPIENDRGRSDWINPEFIHNLSSDRFVVTSRTRLHADVPTLGPGGATAVPGCPIPDEIEIALNSAPFLSTELQGQFSDEVFFFVEAESLEGDLATQLDETIQFASQCAGDDNTFESAQFVREIPGIGNEPVLVVAFGESVVWTAAVSRSNVVATVAVQTVSGGFGQSETAAIFDSTVALVFETMLNARPEPEIFASDLPTG